MIKLKTDTKFFDTGMIRAQVAVRLGSIEGMKASMELFKSDTLNKPPKAPYKTGRLAKGHVTDVTVLGTRVVGSLSVIGVPYAASLHEGISRWGTPYVYKTLGTGMKWIESKALIYNRRYLRDLSNFIVAKLKSAFRSLR